ncbi:MAG: tetratricopeptide repeat protein [Betaproteobacteria bacterium]|nr:tetratricopeptide repeat protein [Betaproteobacteria bacterium]
MSAERLQAARELHGAGQIEEALAAYSALLAEREDDAELWHLRAIAEHQLGRAELARTSAGRAIAIDAAPPAYHLIAGHAASDAGDPRAAAVHYAAAVARKPDWAAAWIALGSARIEEADAGGAREAFQQATILESTAARAWNGLGLAELGLDRPEQAQAAFRRALEAEPGFALAHLNLARLAEREGKFDEALESLESALRADPRLVDALLLRAQLLRRKRDPRAGGAHKVAVQAIPDDARLRAAWADFLWEAGLTTESVREFQRAETLDPTSLRAALGARLVLPAVYRDEADLEANRARYAQGLDELHAGMSRFTGARPNAALVGASWTNFYLAYQGRNDRDLQSRYGDFVAGVLRANLPEFFADRPPPRPGGRLRVGFLSHFFFNCTVGRYFASWIRDLDRTRFEPVVFYTNAWVADDTRAIAAAADRFHHVSGYPLHAIARRVAAEELDILVYPELGMHAETFALAALRLAPVQVAGWGHPTTSGLATMDAYLTCAEMEPEGAQAAYRERLVGLPGIGTRYQRPRTESTKDREALGLPVDATLYLCPQSLFKIHPANDGLFARVLSEDPRARLVFFGYKEGPVTQNFRRRLFEALARAGIDAERRTVFLGFLSHGDYLRVNAVCDVMLDTLHWSGGNTSLDAIAAGLPLVTLPGELMRGRQSAAMLRRLGLEALVAKDADDYVRIALRLGTDAAWRREIRAALEARAGALFDDTAPVEAFARALEDLAGRGR